MANDTSKNSHWVVGDCWRCLKFIASFYEKLCLSNGNITMKEQSMFLLSVDDWCVSDSCYGQWLMWLRFLLRSMTDVFEVLATVNDGSRSLTFCLRLSLLRCFLSDPHRPWDSQRCAPSPEALYKVFSQWREWSVTDEGLSSRGMVEAGSSSCTFLSPRSWTTQSSCKSWLCLLIIIWLNCWYLLLGIWRRCSVDDESDAEE